jgi:hypothetical protein
VRRLAATEGVRVAESQGVAFEFAIREFEQDRGSVAGDHELRRASGQVAIVFGERPERVCELARERRLGIAFEQSRDLIEEFQIERS